VTKVVVTGMGAIAPIGTTAAECFESAACGRSGVDRVPAELYAGTASLAAARVRADVSAHWPAHQRSQFDRATQLALIAAAQAIADSELRLSDDESLRAGVYWARDSAVRHPLRNRIDSCSSATVVFVPRRSCSG